MADLDHLQGVLTKLRGAKRDREQLQEIYLRHFSPEGYLERYMKVVMNQLGGQGEPEKEETRTGVTRAA